MSVLSGRVTSRAGHLARLTGYNSATKTVWFRRSGPVCGWCSCTASAISSFCSKALSSVETLASEPRQRRRDDLRPTEKLVNFILHFGAGGILFSAAAVGQNVVPQRCFLEPRKLDKDALAPLPSEKRNVMSV